MALIVYYRRKRGIWYFCHPINTVLAPFLAQEWGLEILWRAFKTKKQQA